MEQLVDAPQPPVALRVVRVAAPVAATVMAATVAVGLLAAPTGAAAELLANTWGRVTLVDLYLAFGAVWVWIAWRERSVVAAVVWAVLLVVGGSIALWGYVAWRAREARDMAELLVGPADIGT